jgi:hypothetical protein
LTGSSNVANVARFLPHCEVEWGTFFDNRKITLGVAAEVRFSTIFRMKEFALKTIPIEYRLNVNPPTLSANE